MSKKTECKHEHTRHLDCEEHGDLCWEIICCECGDTVAIDEERKAEWERGHPKAKHTPGPWERCLVAGAVQVRANKRSVPIAIVYRGANRDADARLISKAPAMLAKLKDAARTLRGEAVTGKLKPELVDLLFDIDELVAEVEG